MGKGGKGGGGGGGQVPQINVPAGLYSTIGSESGLGSYAQSLLDPLASMTNWASNIASGGQGANIPTYASTAIQPGPQVYFGSAGASAGGKNLWNTSFDPRTGLVTYTNPRDPNQTFTGNVAGDSTGSLDPATKQQWINDWNANRTGQNVAGGGGGGDWSKALISGTLPQGITPEQAQQFYQENTGQSAPDLQTAINYFNQKGSLSAGQNPLGPFLGQAWGNLQQAEAATGQIAPIQAQTRNLNQQATDEASSLLSTGQSELDYGTGLLKEATTGTGLFPSQQAMIDLAVKTEQSNLASKLGEMGLSQSTQAPELAGEASVAGAGQAGALVQGNISAAEAEQQVGQQTINLGQAAQKIALGAQTLELGEQNALVTELTQISAQSAQLQATLWQEAMQGYGTLGSIIDSSAKSYGYSLQGYGAILQAETQQADLQAQIESQQAQQDSSATSGLFGALGKILGGVGGSLAGGAAGGGAAAGGSGLLSSIIGGIGAIFAAL